MSETKDFALDELKKKALVSSTISVGISWIDGRCVFRPDKKHAQCWYGICHFSDMVFNISPIDYQDATMLKTIKVSPSEGYCEKAHTCLNFDCTARHPITGTPVKLNKFDKNLYVYEFKDIGFSSLGLPDNIGTETLWFNNIVQIGDKPYHFKFFWGKVIKPYKPDGVVLEYSEYTEDQRIDRGGIINE